MKVSAYETFKQKKIDHDIVLIELLIILRECNRLVIEVELFVTNSITIAGNK